MDILGKCKDVDFVQRAGLNQVVETLVHQQYDGDNSWAEALPLVVDLINLKLKEFEETDWKSGHRGRLTENGLILLGDVFKQQIERANRKWKQPVFAAFSRFLDVVEHLLSPDGSSGDRVFVPPGALASIVFRDWRRINLTLLWEMTRRNIVSIETFLTVHGSKKNNGEDEDGELPKRFRDELMAIAMRSAESKDPNDDRQRDDDAATSPATGDDVIFDEFVHQIVTLALDEGAPCSNKANRCVDDLLKSALRRFRQLENDQIEDMLDRNAGKAPFAQSLKPFHAVLGSIRFAKERKKMIFRLIDMLLTSNANETCSNAVALQNEWALRSASASLREIGILYSKIAALLDPAVILSRVLNEVSVKDKEINHRFFLFLISCLVSVSEKTTATLVEAVDVKMDDTLREDAPCRWEDLILSFLLIRQTGFESLSFTYEKWFSASFGSLSSTKAKSKRSFGLLVKFLSSLVPFEPASFLKVHLLHPPATDSPGCKQVWQDYVALAKTRLADLKASFDQACIFRSSEAGFQSASPSKSPSKSNVVKQDVQTATAAFENNGKIPSSVLEASMFKRSYFVDQFLPCLLKPRSLPDSPDATMRFIQLLVDAKKIPPPLYQGYLDACQMEKLRVVAAAGINEVEEPEFSSSASPLELIEQQLHKFGDQLLREFCPDDGVGFRHRRSSDSILRDLGSDVDSILRDLSFRPPTPRRLHFRLVDVLLTGFCQTVLKCHATGNETPRAWQWMTSFVAMVARLTDIRHLVLTRLIELITVQLGILDDHRVFALAKFFAIVAVMEDRFELNSNFRTGASLPEKSADESFPEYVFRLLPMNDGPKTLFRVFLLGSSYLDQVLGFPDDSAKSVALPRILISKLKWLSSRVRHCYFNGPPVGVESLPPEVQEVAGQFHDLDKTGAFDFEDPPTLEEWIRFELEISTENDFLPISGYADYLEQCVGNDESNLAAELYLVLLRYLMENAGDFNRCRRQVSAIVDYAQSKSSRRGESKNKRDENEEEQISSPLLCAYSRLRNDRDAGSNHDSTTSNGPPAGLLTAFFRLISTPTTNRELVENDIEDSLMSAGSPFVRELNRFLRDVIDDPVNRSGLNLPNDVALYLWESMLILPDVDVLDDDVVIATLPHLPFVRRQLSPDGNRRLAKMLSKPCTLKRFDDALLQIVNSSPAVSRDVATGRVLRELSEKMKAALLLTSVRCHPRDFEVDRFKLVVDALCLDINSGAIVFMHLLLAEINSYRPLGASSIVLPLPYLSHLVEIIAFLLTNYSCWAFKEMFTKKAMSSVSGLVPKGMIKRNAVALLVALDLIFRDNKNSSSSNNRNDNDDDDDEATNSDVRRKLVEGKLLQLICLTTRVVRVGGMIDDSVAAVARNLFKNFLANSPEHLRHHHEGMLAKDNEVFLA